MPELLTVGFVGAAPFNLAKTDHGFLIEGLSIVGNVKSINRSSDTGGKYQRQSSHRLDVLIATERFSDTAALLNRHDISRTVYADYVNARSVHQQAVGILLRSTGLSLPDEWIREFNGMIPPCPPEKLGTLNDYYLDGIAALALQYCHSSEGVAPVSATELVA